MVWVPARSNAFTFNDTEITNCIISDVANYSRDVGGMGLNFQSNNFSGGFAARGTAASVLDPSFVNAPAHDFHLTDVLIDAGVDLPSVNHDMDRVQRVLGTYSLGAYEKDLEP